MEAPEFYHQTAGFSSTLDSKPSGGCDHFMVEDLLDFSNHDNGTIATATTNDVGMGNVNFDAFVPAGNYHTEDSSTFTAVDSCNSSSASDHPHNFNSLDSHFCNDLSVPYDDLAELEWLSNFVEESFSSEDLQKLQLISGMKTRPGESAGNSQPDLTTTNPSDTTTIITNTHNNHNNGNPSHPIFHSEMMSVPAKARSKRSRAAPMSWASRLLVLSSSSSPPPSPSPATPTTSSDREILIGPPSHPGKKPSKPTAPRKRVEGGEANGEGRKCLHCATDKTPQWRTGPMGPKTLCNACGVRYKSGRLVPEYRPAASPTFVLTKHSNSHRKVLELRRQKELLRAQQQQQHFLHHHQPGMVFDVSSSNGGDYLIHQHVGPNFRQLI